MLVNELISNSIKHSRGSVTVNAYCKEGEIVLEVCDEGAGFAPDFDPRKAAHTGMELVLMLVHHDLAGEITFGYAHPQTAQGGLVRVRFAQETDRSGEP